MDPPVASFAKEKGLLLLQPEKPNQAEFLNQISLLAPDIVVTCAYGKILPQAFLDLPTRGVINIHPSLLPQYRGPTPIQSALLDGCYRWYFHFVYGKTSGCGEHYLSAAV